MVPRTLWRVGALVCACLALGALCGFALPVPEDWLAPGSRLFNHLPLRPA